MSSISVELLYAAAFSLVGVIAFVIWQRKRSSGDSGVTSVMVKGSVLDQYITNFTALAREGKLSPVIGRQAEVDQLVRILSRKTKNNALLLGEPGVGKTAVVERLAEIIAKGTDIDTLRDKDIVALDLASLVSGTKYRGELEKRLDAVKGELESRSGEVVLFVDEIQQLSQASGAEGGLNPADILKPELARGSIQVIGATTYDEYEKYILPDETLERRFQPIHIHEATIEETLDILHGVKSVFEEFHNVSYSEEAINAMIELSKKYISKRFLPDKAIDILDESGVRAHIASLKNKTAEQPVVTKEEVRHVIAEWADKPINKIN